MTKLLLYCTKAKPYLYGHYVGFETLYHYDLTNDKKVFDSHEVLNGKIVAECECDKVEEFGCYTVPYRNYNNLGYEHFIDNGVYKVEWNKNNLNGDGHLNNDDGVVFERNDRYIDTMFKNGDLNKICLSHQELLDYIKLGNKGYAIHLSKLKIFDDPKELYEFYKDDFLQELNEEDTEIKKAPQNMCYVYDRKGNKYILISIRPEWLCKILNGEKTIEIRKQIVNDLKKKDN